MFTLQNLRSDFENQLSSYLQAYPDEAAVVSDFNRLLQDVPDPFSSREQRGHFTVAAIVVALPEMEFLMVHHPTLQRWLQPGGHVELGVDQTARSGAIRECEEETGVALDETNWLLEYPVDIDCHAIPESKKLGKHHHYDLRYLFITKKQHLSLPDVRWFTVDEMFTLSDKSLTRFTEKAIRTIGRNSSIE